MPLPVVLPAALSSKPAVRAALPAFQFKGAYLGMSLADWRAMAFPGAHSALSTVKPVCSTDPSGPSAGLILTPMQRKAGMVVCTYASQYGRYVLPQALPIDRQYQARTIRYAFRSGRLASIGYQTSVDAFDDLARRFDSLYGLPVQLVRDDMTVGTTRFARVRQTWRSAGLTIDMVDPAPRTLQLSIRFTATPAGLDHARSSLALKLGPRLPPA